MHHEPIPRHRLQRQSTYVAPRLWPEQCMDLRCQENRRALARSSRARSRVARRRSPARKTRNLSARRGNFVAAGIDAPFSVPRAFVGPESYASLLERIGALPDQEGRPFLRSADFVNAVAGVNPPLNPPKPMRSTDAYWSQKGLNVRSTLWAGARGGAAMTAACFKLLHRAQRPIWPWVQESRGLIVEAFPMAQLKYWGLPFNGYGKQDQKGEMLRKQIIDGLRGRIDIGRFDEVLILNADALDSCPGPGTAPGSGSATCPSTRNGVRWQAVWQANTKART
jgi:Protein of unknown function (DUF429)